ncbi:hypothetical protein [Streptomyces sp. NPDC058735]|uniref:hypothetical protein n=1 Tax=unclassified Streptomyces TaxID=2593676 RepID=UPI0036A6E130
MIRWYGWGVLALPVLVVSLFAGVGVATSLLWDLAAQGGDRIDHGGVPLGGLAVGLIVGGLLNQALGVALNTRRMPDGTRVRTNRHGLGDDVPVERFGRGQAITGILALPLCTVQFVSAPVVWTLVIAWTVLVVTALVRPARRGEAAGGTRRP